MQHSMVWSAVVLPKHYDTDPCDFCRKSNSCHRNPFPVGRLLRSGPSAVVIGGHRLVTVIWQSDQNAHNESSNERQQRNTWKSMKTKQISYSTQMLKMKRQKTGCGRRNGPSLACITPNSTKTAIMAKIPLNRKKRIVMEQMWVSWVKKPSPLPFGVVSGIVGDRLEKRDVHQNAGEDE